MKFFELKLGGKLNEKTIENQAINLGGGRSYF